MDETGKKTSVFGDILKANLAADAIKAGLSAIVDMVKAVGAAVKDYVDDSMGMVTAAAESQTLLTQVMRNTMDASDEEVKRLIDLAAAQEKVGVVSKTAQTTALAELASFVERKEALEDMLPVMNDYIAILTKDRYGNEVLAYGGDFGERPADYEFCGNGLVYADRTPTPKMQEVRFVYQNICITVEQHSALIQNRSLFTRTGEYDCVVLLEKEGRLLASEAICVDIAPLARQKIDLPLSVPPIAGEYVITVSFRLKRDTKWAKTGHEIAFAQHAVSVPGEQPADSPAGALAVTRGRHNLGVKGENFEVLFSRLKGGLVSYRWAGEEQLKSVPMPSFWRAPTDNDRGNLMPARYGQWKLASQYASHLEPFTFVNRVRSRSPALDVRQGEDSVTVTFQYFLPITPASSCETVYTVAADGTVALTLTYDPVEGLPDLPAFGFMMKLDAAFDRLEWYGLWPEETYLDRRCGGKLGVYRRLVAEQMARHLAQETGNKMDVRLG